MNGLIRRGGRTVSEAVDAVLTSFRLAGVGGVGAVIGTIGGAVGIVFGTVLACRVTNGAFGTVESPLMVNSVRPVQNSSRETSAGRAVRKLSPHT